MSLSEKWSQLFMLMSRAICAIHERAVNKWNTLNIPLRGPDATG